MGDDTTVQQFRANNCYHRVEGLVTYNHFRIRVIAGSETPRGILSCGKLAVVIRNGFVLFKEVLFSYNLCYVK